VRLIGEDGEMIGVVSRKQALEAAEKANLDLVEISPNAEPPVCKILDNGKYKYELQKKKAEAKKKQKIVETKEIQLGPLINDNDFEVKKRAAERFIKDGNKVKVTMRFKGRQMSHPEVGLIVINRFKDYFDEIAKIETAPRFEGKQILMIIAPKT
jgi:translation initiation factor IF-3